MNVRKRQLTALLVLVAVGMFVWWATVRHSGAQLTNPVTTTIMWSGTSSAIGGGLLAAGACASTTVAATGATTAMVADANPSTYPGDGTFWLSYVSATDQVTVRVCAAVLATPVSSTYKVRVIQ